MLKWPRAARSAAAINAVSPGSGMPADSARTSTKSNHSPAESTWLWMKWVIAARRQCTGGLELPRMRVGVPKETVPGERRVARVPETVSGLAQDGFEVLVESGAGEEAAFLDAAYSEAGASLVDVVWGKAEAVVKVQKPTPEEAERLREGDLLIGFLQPLTDTD